VAYRVFAVLRELIARDYVLAPVTSHLLIKEIAPMLDPAENSPSREQIEARAYEIYPARRASANAISSFSAANQSAMS
jgi:hypothetical protein